jgi:hypothetical protein
MVFTFLCLADIVQKESKIEYRRRIQLAKDFPIMGIGRLLGIPNGVQFLNAN